MAGRELAETARAVKSGIPLLAARGLTKAFPGTVALDRVDLDVSAGEVHALLGENGSGKSTLIKVLSGYHVPDAGSVEIDGQPLEFGSSVSSYDLGCRFIHQDLALVETMTVRDNLMLGAGFPSRLATVRDRAAEREARQMLARAGVAVNPKQFVSALSPAQRTGVAVARALRGDVSVETKVLVMDEPTATLPEAEVTHLLEIIRAVARGGVGVLYVTHRLDEVGRVADNLTVLRDGVKVADAAARGMAREDLVRLLVGSDFEEPPRATGPLIPSSEPLLSVDGLTSESLDRVSLEARPGEVVGIAGITGSGREALLGTIFGALPRFDGRVTVSGREVHRDGAWAAVSAGIGYLPADRKSNGGVMNLPVRENLTLARLRPLWKAPFLRRTREDAECRRWFEQLSIRPKDRFNETLERFSGGNQQKVLLAKWLRLEPRVLLLDEPTQGVDVASKAEIHRQLTATAHQGAAVLIASSDVDELAAVCTRVVVLHEGHPTAELQGDRVRVDLISREAHGSEPTGRTT